LTKARTLAFARLSKVLAGRDSVPVEGSSRGLMLGR
jgi:hypothetical protein